MTDDILDRAAAIVEQATPGPWELRGQPWRPDGGIYRVHHQDDLIDSIGFIPQVPNRPRWMEDMALIALAPSLGAALALAKAAEDADLMLRGAGISLPDVRAALAAFKASLAESIKED